MGILVLTVQKMDVFSSEMPRHSFAQFDGSQTSQTFPVQSGFREIVGHQNKSGTPSINKTTTIKSTAMIFILSRRENTKSRNVYRNILSGSGVHFMFVVGTCCPIPIQLRNMYTCDLMSTEGLVSNKDMNAQSVQCDIEDAQIRLETTIYKDILITNTTDVYRHLPAKVRLMLHWGVHNTNCSFFVKVDEDHFINPIALMKMVSGRSDAEYSIICNLAKGFYVHREGKWKELTYKRGVFYAQYPKFPLGSSGWIMSRSVAKYISKHTLELFDYQGEDVSIGIWLHESDIVGNIQWISSTHMRADGNCLDSNNIVVGHNLSPEQIQLCWDIQPKKIMYK
jgi:hypothetical protein